jgi:hypothetical protein
MRRLMISGIGVTIGCALFAGCGGAVRGTSTGATTVKQLISIDGDTIHDPGIYDGPVDAAHLYAHDAVFTSFVIRHRRISVGLSWVVPLRSVRSADGRLARLAGSLARCFRHSSEQLDRVRPSPADLREFNQVCALDLGTDVAEVNLGSPHLRLSG